MMTADFVEQIERMTMACHTATATLYEMTSAMQDIADRLACYANRVAHYATAGIR